MISLKLSNETEFSVTLYTENNSMELRNKLTTNIAYLLTLVYYII